MNRYRLLIFMFAFLVWPGIAQADLKVTANPVIQTDLAMAKTFWQIEYPNIVPPCFPRPVKVVETTMNNGVGDNNTLVPAADVWAETRLSSCTIKISPSMWASVGVPDTTQQWEVCVAIAHEYGHTLGLPDTESIPMMSTNWNRRDDPLCDQYVYGWRWTLHKDREWLAEYHLDRRHREGVAP